MITKRKLIELIQDRLGSSGTPADLRTRYPFQVVEVLIAKAYADIAYLNPSAAEDLAIQYTGITVTAGVASLPVKPVGSFGVLWVESAGVLIPVEQGGMESKILKKVEPGKLKGCLLQNGNTLKIWDCDIDTVDVLMIPDFAELDQSQEVVMPGVEMMIYQQVIEVIRSTDTRPQEVYNDGREDAPKVAPKEIKVNG